MSEPVSQSPQTSAAQPEDSASSESGLDVAFFRAWITLAAARIDADRDRLTKLDAQIGDGDHGVNLARGFSAVTRTLDTTAPSTPGTVLTLTGTTLISKVGGASGPLYGSAFRRAGQSFPQNAESISLPDLARGLEAALTAIRTLGTAKDGDKTMVDALSPAVAALNAAVERGADLVEALSAAADAAYQGAQATIPLQAHKGRASYLGERSMGHEDPGAASAALILGALRDTAVEHAGGGPASGSAHVSTSAPAADSGAVSSADGSTKASSGDPA